MGENHSKKKFKAFENYSRVHPLHNLGSKAKEREIGGSYYIQTLT